MKFSLVSYVSEDIISISDIISFISKEIEETLKNKDYGEDIESVYIGIVCVNPIFSHFFKYREKYIKSKKAVEYSIVLNYNDFKNFSEKDSVKKIVTYILISIEKIIDKYKIKQFDVDKYIRDIKELALQKNWFNI